jgi:hypothetical protein
MPKRKSAEFVEQMLPPHFHDFIVKKFPEYTVVYPTQTFRKWRKVSDRSRIIQLTLLAYWSSSNDPVLKVKTITLSKSGNEVKLLPVREDEFSFLIDYVYSRDRERYHFTDGLRFTTIFYDKYFPHLSFLANRGCLQYADNTNHRSHCSKRGTFFAPIPIDPCSEHVAFCCPECLELVDFEFQQPSNGLKFYTNYL